MTEAAILTAVSLLLKASRGGRFMKKVKNFRIFKVYSNKVLTFQKFVVK